MNPIINSPVCLLNMEQISRALVVCLAADVPVAIWGGVGTGKTETAEGVVASLGWRLFPCQLALLEPSDIAGIPVPDLEKMVARWLMSQELPFEHLYGDIRCVVFFDEADRASMEVLNAALRLIRNRSVNNFRLSPNCRVVIAGNAETDIGTTTLSSAMANRMCHLYVEDGTEGAYKSWEKWALQQPRIEPGDIGFAKFRNELFASKTQITQEMAFLSRRSYVDGLTLYRMAGNVNFRADDICLALVAGCMGKAAAVEYLAYKEMVDKAPTVEEVLAAPDDCPVPADPSVLYAVTLHLVGCASSREKAEDFARYGLRWPREAATYLFKLLADKEPAVVTTQAYQAWVKKGA